jgi:hypothetical protein
VNGFVLRVLLAHPNCARGRATMAVMGLNMDMIKNMTQFITLFLVTLGV